MNILSLSPEDLRCSISEGHACSFEILHQAPDWPGLTKYAALFQKATAYQLRFFHAEDVGMRETVIDALDQLRSESKSAEARTLLGEAARTLRALYDARPRSSAQELPASFTDEAAWRALRGALRDEE